MIFFFDIDGTLLDNRSMQIPKSTVEALDALHRKGHLLYLNTSRSEQELANVRTQLSALPLDGAVLTGGAMTLHRGQCVRRMDADSETMRRALELLEAMNSPVRWQAVDALHFQNEPTQEIETILTGLFGEVPTVRRWDGRPLMRLICYAEGEPLRRLKEALPKAQVEDQGYSVINITAKGVDKADAMLAEAARLGFSVNEIAAFGDGLNDLAMLESAGYGIAMGNGPQAVHRAARESTDAVDKDGIFKALMRHGWI